MAQIEDPHLLAEAFKDSNVEICELLKRGVYIYSPDTIAKLLQHKVIKTKLTNLLHFYRKPDNTDPLASGQLNWQGLPLTNTLKTFIAQLSKKLELHPEQAFRLTELFFIHHPQIFDRVKLSESELVQHELSTLFRPITQLYYTERTFLIRALAALVIQATNSNSPCQEVCLSFLTEADSQGGLDSIVWAQYQDTCKRELPGEVFAPQDREEWYLQLLQEEKELLELLLLLNYDYVHCTPEKLMVFLDTFVRQKFKGSYEAIITETHLPDYRQQINQLATEIGDTSMFLILASIRLDVFADRGLVAGFIKNKNPYNLLSHNSLTPKIQEFFLALRNGPEYLPEQLGPVILAWMCVVSWGKLFPDEYTALAQIQTEPLEDLAKHFNILEYLKQITTRPPFRGLNKELSSALKYLLKSLVASLHSRSNVEKARNYHLLVEVTCATLENSTLAHFWSEDFTNKSGLYIMLSVLSSKFPHDARGFLQFVNVLVGSRENGFATQVVKYLDSLTTYTSAVNIEDVVSTPDPEFNLVSTCQLSNRSLVIPQGTPAAGLQQIARDKMLVCWNIRYSLWPVFFICWEETLEDLKHGQIKSPAELEIIFQYVELLCKILTIEPGLSETIEALGNREPANNPLDYPVNEKPIHSPNSLLSKNLMLTFIHSTKLARPPIRILSKVIDSLKVIYELEKPNVGDNAVALTLQKLGTEQHSSPLFLSANKLLSAQHEQGDYSISVSMLNFIYTILQDHFLITVFPLEISPILREALKYMLSEVLPECTQWPSEFRWEALSIIMKSVQLLLKKFPTIQTPIYSPFLDLITTQLNKSEVAEPLQKLLEVRIFKHELKEVTYENIHWNQAFTSGAEPDLLRSIRLAIESGLGVMETAADLLLYLSSGKKNSALERLQFLNDCNRLFFMHQVEEEKLAPVGAFMAYAGQDFSKFTLETEEILAVPALRLLTKIIVLWQKSPSRPSLQYFLSGPHLPLKHLFFKAQLDMLLDKGPDLPRQSKTQATLSFLEFLTVSLPTQRVLLSSIFTDSIAGHARFDQILKALFFGHRSKVEEVDICLKELTCHLLIFIEQLFTYSQLYKTTTESLRKDSNFLNDLCRTVQAVFGSESRGYEACLALHSFSYMWNLCAMELLREEKSKLLDLLVSRDWLEFTLRMAGRVNISETTTKRIQEAEIILGDYSYSLSDFVAVSFAEGNFWNLFDSSCINYGPQYYWQVAYLPLFLQTQSIPPIITDLMSTLSHSNTEKSLIDSQSLALNSFKNLMAVISSLTQKDSKDTKLALLSLTDNESESTKEALKISGTIIQVIWQETFRETSYNDNILGSCLTYKHEILAFSYSMAAFLLKKHSQLKISIEEGSLMIKTTSKILAEVPELLRLVDCSSEILTFLLVLLHFAGGSNEEYTNLVTGIAPLIGSALASDKTPFALGVTVLDEISQIVPQDTCSAILKQTNAIRTVVDKLASATCTQQDFLAVLKFSISYSRGAAGARHLISEKILGALNQNPILRLLNGEYEDRYRSTNHLLWCWVITLLTRIVESLPDEPGLLPHILSFLNTYNARIQQVLAYNLQNDTILTHKQFSLGYLEELDKIIELIVCCSRTGVKSQLTQWANLIKDHTLRIAASDISYTFPPLADHETMLSNEFAALGEVSQSLPKLQTISESLGITVLDTLSSLPREEGWPAVRQYKPSIFTFKVETTLLKILSNSLHLLLRLFTSEGKPIFRDGDLLLNVLKFCVNLSERWTGNSSYIINLCKLAKEAYSSVESSLAYGSINHTYSFDHSQSLATLTSSAETTIFLLIKHLAFIQGREAKNNANSLFRRWKGTQDSPAKNGFLTWSEDYFSEISF